MWSHRWDEREEVSIPDIDRHYQIKLLHKKDSNDAVVCDYIIFCFMKKNRVISVADFDK